MSTGLASSRRAGVSLVEVLVVIGIIALLLGILLPAVEKSREHVMNVKCASNLSQIGISLQIYANENQGRYPRTVYDPAAPLCYGTNASAYNPFNVGGPQANDVTAALFLLVRVQDLPPVIFNEPYTDELSNEPDSVENRRSRSNFTDYKKNLGYSYANPYPNDAAAKNGYLLTNKISPTFALAADLNPGVVGQNSRNHEGRGQNVLYGDIHVSWQTTPKCGQEDDDIYSNKSGMIQASPVGVGDSVLLPTEQ